MSDIEFIPPQTAVIAFSPEPAYNALCSMMLLKDDLSGFSQWVYRSAASLSPEQLRTNDLVCEAAKVYLDGVPWPSFPAWVDDLAGRDPRRMRDRSLTHLSERAQQELGEEGSRLPTPGELLDERSAYVSLVQRLHECKGSGFDAARHEWEHALLQDPAGRQELLITHLRWMWDELLAAEWARNLPLLQESAAAFQSIDYAGRSPAEVLREVSARDRVPRGWEVWLVEIEQLIFVPSAHIGPYLLLIDHTERTARIVFGARMPRGATIASPALNRSELLTRLSALADDTRLSILELVAREGKASTQDLITELGISQSSASRHLRQLSATGYLTEQRREGAKYYRLNPTRLDDTLGSLKRFLA
jgi:ArsR family transcriptional regulator